MRAVTFSFDPAVIVLIAAALALYMRAVRILARRGYEVPFWQQVAWYAGLGLTTVGLLSPVDTLGEELLSAHMIQHLLIADLAAPLLLVGLRTPVLVFYLPRPVLVPLARSKQLRAFFRTIRRPLVALPLFIVILYGWHFAFAFGAALDNGLVHALQHQSFVIGSVLVWWSVIDPKHRRLHGELWKAGHLLGTRLASMFLGMAFLLMSTPAYSEYYGDRARDHGMTPLGDQQLAGGLMMITDILIMLAVFTFFFWRSAADHDRGERAARERTAA